MLVDGVRIKSRISLKDLGRVFDLYEELVEVEKASASLPFRQRIKAIYQVRDNIKAIISTITEVAKPRRKHIKSLYKYVEAAGLMGKGQDKGSKDKLTEVAAWAGARGKLSVDQVLEGFTADELGVFISELQQEKIEDSLSRIKAHHIPKEFMNEIKKNMSKLKLVKSKRKRLKTTTADEPPQKARIVPFDVGAFGAGFQGER